MRHEMTAAEAAKQLDTLIVIEGEAKSKHYIAFMEYVASIMHRVASGELAEVKHAHWEYRGCGWPYCSNCDTDALEGGDEEPIESAHCSKCGALMEKGDNYNV